MKTNDPVGASKRARAAEARQPVQSVGTRAFARGLIWASARQARLAQLDPQRSARDCVRLPAHGLE